LANLGAPRRKRKERSASGGDPTGRTDSFPEKCLYSEMRADGKLKHFVIVDRTVSSQCPFENQVGSITSGGWFTPRAEN
jgi:hypothetical protein